MVTYWDARPRRELKQNWKAAIVNRLKWLEDHRESTASGYGGVVGTTRRAETKAEFDARRKKNDADIVARFGVPE